MSDDFACFLFDNGSFRADSTRSLRGVAARLAERLGHPVRAVSLLHSTRVPAAELDGVKAELLEPALDSWFAERPMGRALLMPLFFGPSGALTDYVPERLASLRERHPGGRALLAEALVLPDEEPVDLVAILADRVRATMAERSWRRPKVVLCDHGTPQRAVSAVRDRLAGLLGAALGDEVEAVAPASMERREGEEFAFNEPLLATRLAEAPFDAGEVVVALQFLSPGRHAGPGGDVAEICAAAEAAAGAGGKVLRTAMTAPIADDARLTEVLARRAEAARARLAAVE
ncbi:MAG: cobalamin biosynthesis protein CbiX [Burkholderiales bacterium]|nr:cobalamin biosynthesis protein CbiX [Opitutaceae bacterium]